MASGLLLLLQLLAVAPLLAYAGQEGCPGAAASQQLATSSLLQSRAVIKTAGVNPEGAVAVANASASATGPGETARESVRAENTEAETAASPSKLLSLHTISALANRVSLRQNVAWQLLPWQRQHWWGAKLLAAMGVGPPSVGVGEPRLAGGAGGAGDAGGHWQISGHEAIWVPEDVVEPQPSPSYASALWGNIPYIVLVFMVALIYVKCGYRTEAIQAGAPTKPPGIEDLPSESFHFGLCDVSGCCGRDAKICVFGWLCTGIRWADTLSQPKLRYGYGFWFLLTVFTVLMALDEVTLMISCFIFAGVGVYCRQRLRATFGLKHGTASTYCKDILIWLFCGICAAVQEAREVEYISLPTNVP